MPTPRSTARSSGAGSTPLIPAKAEPIRARVPLRRFRYDARHDILKCPRGRILRPDTAGEARPLLLLPRRDCARCPLGALCLSKGRVNKAVVVGDDYPALLRARRRRERWSDEDRRLYQRHRWRSEGFHGEAKTWHGLARAVRRGLANMRIQAYLTAAAVNLKRLAAAFPFASPALDPTLGVHSWSSDHPGVPASHEMAVDELTLHGANVYGHFFNEVRAARVQG